MEWTASKLNKLKKIVNKIKDERIPSEATVGDYIQEGDKLICDFETNEIWVKGVIKFQNPKKNITADISLKVQLDQSISTFK